MAKQKATEFQQKKSLKNSDEIFISKAILKDAEDILRIHTKVWKSTYSSLMDISFIDEIPFIDRLEKRQNIIKAATQGSDKICIKAVLKDKIVGFCDAGPARDNEHEYEGEIYRLYILKDYQSRKIGKNLFTEAVEFLEKVNYRPFVLWVLGSNHSARKFYKKLGGKEILGMKKETGTEKYEEICYLFK